MKLKTWEMSDPELGHLEFLAMVIPFKGKPTIMISCGVWIILRSHNPTTFRMVGFEAPAIMRKEAQAALPELWEKVKELGDQAMVPDPTPASAGRRRKRADSDT